MAERCCKACRGRCGHPLRASQLLVGWGRDALRLSVAVCETCSASSLKPLIAGQLAPSLPPSSWGGRSWRARAAGAAAAEEEMQRLLREQRSSAEATLKQVRGRVRGRGLEGSGRGRG